MFSALMRSLQWLRCKVRELELGPNAAYRTLREQYACHRLGRDEYERLKRDLRDEERSD